MSNSRNEDPSAGSHSAGQAAGQRQRDRSRAAEPADAPESWLDSEVHAALSDDEDALAELAELARLAQLARQIRASLARPRVQLSEAERCDHIEAAVLDRLGFSLPAAAPEPALASELARLRRLRRKPNRAEARTTRGAPTRGGTTKSHH